MPAAANSLQLEWPEPWGCGAPVSGYAVEMAPADAVLTVQGPPTPPQVSALSRSPLHLNGQQHTHSLFYLATSNDVFSPGEHVFEGRLTSLSLSTRS